MMKTSNKKNEDEAQLFVTHLAKNESIKKHEIKGHILKAKKKARLKNFIRFSFSLYMNSCLCTLYSIQAYSSLVKNITHIRLIMF